MNEVEFVAAIAKELEEDAADMSLSTQLEDLDSWDSVGVLGVIALVDSEFGVILEPGDLEKCSTVGDLYKLIMETNSGS